MEPNNLQYRQLLNQLEFSSRRYQNSPYGTGYGMGGSSCGTETSAVTCGWRIRAANVWEEISVHACKGKDCSAGRPAACADDRFMALGSVIETSTLFLLAAASFSWGS